MTTIDLQSLQKYYGKHIGIQNVSFSVNAGEIFGFVGPNGAGKSTTIKILMGFIFAQKGTATICGLDVVKNAKEIKTFTGYVPSDVRLYPIMQVGALLKRNAAFYHGDHHKETERLCALFEIDTSKRFHELSTGNKKKVSLICALSNHPKVIVLDEPTNGLDPMMQKLLFEELIRRAKEGATVFLSSHNLAEVQEYCGRVAFIKEGVILDVVDLSKIAKTQGKILTLTGGKQQIPDGFTLLQANEDIRIFRTALSAAEIIHALSAIAPADFTLKSEHMEDVFWDLYELEEQE